MLLCRSLEGVLVKKCCYIAKNLHVDGNYQGWRALKRLQSRIFFAEIATFPRLATQLNRNKSPFWKK